MKVNDFLIIGSGRRATRHKITAITNHSICIMPSLKGAPTSQEYVPERVIEAMLTRGAATLLAEPVMAASEAILRELRGRNAWARSVEGNVLMVHGQAVDVMTLNEIITVLSKYMREEENVNVQ